MIVDLIIILVVLLFTFIGYKQGLVKSAIRVLAFFIALIISITFYKPVANIIINNTQVDEKIEATISEKINDKKKEKTKGLPKVITKTGEESVTKLSNSIAIKVMYVLTFIIMFVTIKLVLLLVTFLADFVTKLPIIKQFDKTGGLIYGFVKGSFIVITIFAIISLVSPLLSEQYINTINNSIIGSYLYNNNILINIFS